MQKQIRNLYANAYSNKRVIRYFSGGKECAFDYSNLKKAASQLGKLLTTGSFGPVISIVQNCVEWDIIDFACYTNKITHVSIHPLIEVDLLEKIVKQLRPSFVFLSYKFNLHQLEIILKNSGIGCQVISLQNQEALNDFYSMLDRQQVNTSSRVVDELSSSNSFLQTVIYTSGSTGLSKGVLLSNRNIAAAIDMFSKASFLNDCKTALSLLPLSLSGERKLNYTYKARGITICYPSPLQSMEEALFYFKPDIIALVPFLLEKLRETIEESSAESFSFLKAIVCGGAAIPEQTRLFFKQKNIPLYEVYGLTETASVISFNDKKANKKGTVGKVPSEMKVKIAPDGEILCKGENVTSGYWKNESKTEQLFVNGGWLATGDFGELDEDGFLKITGRKKSAFKNSRGLFISPEELEKKIQEHPLVQYSVVAGENGNHIKAILLLRKSKEELNDHIEELLKKWISHCNKSFKEYERIDYVYIVPEKEWQKDKVQTLSMKVDRSSVSRLITGKKPIRLYSLSTYD